MSSAYSATALGPGDPDDGDAGRQQRGIAIAAHTKNFRYTPRLGYRVPSQSNGGSYVVVLDDVEPLCSCPDYEKRQRSCKHIYATLIIVEREKLTGVAPSQHHLPAGLVGLQRCTTARGRPFWSLAAGIVRHGRAACTGEDRATSATAPRRRVRDRAQVLRH